jgi:hypothetical protein
MIGYYPGRSASQGRRPTGVTLNGVARCQWHYAASVAGTADLLLVITTVSQRSMLSSL